MIAFHQEPNELRLPPATAAMHRARRLVADGLLPDTGRTAPPPSVPKRQAWLFAFWVWIVAAVYFARVADMWGGL